MAVSVELPQMGESVTEGTIIRWLKKEGDWVEEDEPIVEISTEKIDTELPSPVAGVLSEIKVREDETVEVGAVLAVIDETAEKGAEGEKAPAKKKPEAKAEDQPETKAPPKKEEKPAAAPERPAAEEQGRVVALRAEERGAGSPAEVATPLVRKLARELGVNLEQVKGTGPGGRITKQDVLAVAEGGPRPAAEAAPAGAPAKAAPPPSVYAVPTGPHEDVPFTRIRKAIADHMVRSRHTAAHVTDVVEVDVTRVARLRDRAKDDFRRREGFGLTFLPFIASAAIQALRAFPEFNAHVLEDGQTARLFRQVNLGIAVGRDEGLIVPVVHGADGMNLIGLARAINDIATRAKTKGGLKPDDVGGGTFTITNYGSVGGVMDTPIINSPQVAILGTGAVVKRPWVVQVDGADAIAIRQIALHSVSYDHRWIDGHKAALFNVRVKQILEQADFAHELALEPGGE